MTSAGDGMIGDWGVAPRVLVFSDTTQGLTEACECARRFGGRLAAALPVEQALARLDEQVLLDLLILDISQDHGPLLEQLFQRVDECVETAQFESIVIVSPEILDIAAARLGHRDINLMVGRDREGLSAAVASALDRTTPQLNDIGDDDVGLDIRSLVDGIEHNARRIAAPSYRLDSGVREDGPAGFGASPGNPEDRKPDDAMAVRDIIRARRVRDQYFGEGLFADPAWDILLDLTAARAEGRSVAVSSLCIAAAVPATTALRWIKHLTAEGWLQRVADPDDGRRIFIQLTDRAAEAMLAYFSALSRLNRNGS